MKKKILISFAGIALFAMTIGFNGQRERHNELNVKKVEADAYTPLKDLKEDKWKCTYPGTSTVCKSSGTESCYYDC